MSLFKKGELYPPRGHRNRIARYRENKQLFKGNHFDVFEKYQNLPQHKVYISVNLAGLICKKSADFLFGEPPTFSAGKGADSAEQEKLDTWVTENELYTKLQQSATANAYRGDSFFKVRWGQKWGGRVNEAFDPFRIIIDAQNPMYVFPETSPGDATQIEAYHLAFPTFVEGSGDRWILYVETHRPNQIEYSAFHLGVSETRGIEPTSWNILDEIVSARRVEETGVPFPLIVHVPNYAVDDEWEGIDDLSESKPLFDELNRRLSAVSEILDKHADPAIAVPSGVIGEDEFGNPTFMVGRDKVFEVMGKDDVVPQYITWNGQLQSAFEEIDRITELILTNSEIPSVALGKGDAGTSGSSGLAIKFRMNSLLAKINRKRQFYDRALKELFMLCQMVEDAKLGSRKGYEFFQVKIHFKDGLPQDDMELATIMNIRTGGKATLSAKSALMRMDNLTEEQADEELARIEEEAEKANEAAEKMFATEKDLQVEAEPPADEEDPDGDEEENNEEEGDEK